MPNTTALVDALRVEFGAAGIDAAIAAGMRGEAGRFHAREGEVEIGTPFVPAVAFERDAEGIVRRVPA